MPPECQEFVNLVLAQAQHNVDSAKTADSKAQNQKVLDSLNATLKQEESLDPPKTYDAAACKSAVENWKAVASAGPNNALSAEKIAQQNPAPSSPNIVPETATQATQASIGTTSASESATASNDAPAGVGQESQESAFSLTSQVSPPTTSSTSSKTCDSVANCYHSMLDDAKHEDLAAAMDAAQQVDALPKPQRGDRKLARDYNKQGLDAIKSGHFDVGIDLLSKAAQADPGDVEVVSNLAYAYNQEGNFSQAEDAAITALALNPRRTSVWAPLAVTLAKEKHSNDALAAMWLAYQFSADKQKTLEFISARIVAETDPAAQEMYAQSKAWFTENKKPSFN